MIGESRDGTGAEVHRPGDGKPAVYTIGHSNRTFEGFARLLEAHGVYAIADVRRRPGSRRFPHFNRPRLQEGLAGMGVEYRWFEDLGGKLNAPDAPDSPNGGIENPVFRKYADYMRTPTFQRAVDELIVFAGRPGPALLCAERDPNQCHRNLIADFLAARGYRVLHIIDEGPAREHAISPMAKMSPEGLLSYPPGPDQPLFGGSP